MEQRERKTKNDVIEKGGGGRWREAGPTFHGGDKVDRHKPRRLSRLLDVQPPPYLGDTRAACNGVREWGALLYQHRGGVNGSAVTASRQSVYV